MRSDPSYVRAAGERARQAAITRFGFSQTLASYRELLAEWGWPEQTT
jgi:hypothetical protein